MGRRKGGAFKAPKKQRPPPKLKVRKLKNTKWSKKKGKGYAFAG